MRLGYAALALLWLSATGNAYAQTDTRPARNAKQMEEIVVTARKREETLQEAPVAISVITADTIEAAGIEDMNDVGARLPNVSTIDQPAGLIGNEFAPAIRGITTNYRQIGAESGLGIFIDGAYAGNNANGNKFLPPVERIEFLPGPQATLFGKNTTVGVLNIVTKKPGDELEVLANAGGGNNGHQEYGGSVYFPLSDTWGMGLTAGYRKYSGYIRNDNPPLAQDVYLGDYASGMFDGIVGPEMDAKGGAFQLAYRGDTWNFDFLVDYNNTKRTNRPPAERVEGFDALPQDVMSTATPGESEGDETGYTATLTKDFANGGQLTSITNYREFSTDEIIDDDSYFYKVVDIFTWITDQKQKSQELRYSGNAGNASYLLGAYWQDQKLYMYRTGNVLEFTPNLKVIGDMDNETTAVFGNVEFDLGERWGAELGLRRSSETKDMPRYYNDTSEAGYWVGEISDSLKSDRTSYTAALTFAPLDNLNTHLRYSRGYKSGGFGIEFVVLPFEPSPDFYKFNDERADSFELGMKWQASDSWWINAVLFHTDFTDFQVNQLITVEGGPAPFFAIGNAAEARTQGVEVTAIYSGDRLNLNASVGYNNAEYTRWLRPADYDANGATIYEDMSGRELSTPRKTANLLASYEFDLGGGTLDLIGEYQYRGRSVAQPGADPSLFSDPVDQINARIRYNINDNFSVTAWVKNLTDERAITSRGQNLQAGFFTSDFGGGGWYLPAEIGDSIYDQVTGSVQPPRHYGLTLNYRY